MMKETIKPRATPQQIEAFRPAARPRYISDEVVENLYLSVAPGGTRSWRYDANPPKGGSGRIKLTLGRWPAYSLADAREWATALNVQRARGIDPREEKRRVAEEAALAAARSKSVREAFQSWMAHKRRIGKVTQLTLDGYSYLVGKNLLPLHGDRPIRDLTMADIRGAIRDMQERGSVSASNRFLAVIKPFLNWCRLEELVSENVAAPLQKEATPPPKHAGRHLTITELARLYLAAEQLPAERRDTLRLMILTGCRKNEAAAADARRLNNGVWTIPSEGVGRAKNGLAHPLPLGPMALALFEGADGYLFHDKPHRYVFSDLNDEARRILAEASPRPVPHWTLHHIRHGVRTALTSDEIVAMGEVFSEQIGEILLNHSQGKLIRTYNHSRYARQIGRALTAWERLLSAEIARISASRSSSSRRHSPGSAEVALQAIG